MKKLNKKQKEHVSIVWGILYGAHLEVTTPVKTILIKVIDELEQLVLEHEVMTEKDLLNEKIKGVQVHEFQRDKLKKIGREVAAGVERIMKEGQIGTQVN